MIFIAEPPWREPPSFRKAELDKCGAPRGGSLRASAKAKLVRSHFCFFATWKKEEYETCREDLPPCKFAEARRLPPRCDPVGGGQPQYLLRKVCP